ncbi:MAG: sigma-70 family RNA polymerase sigma factor [Armatimonadetes bacterium]|nr:sigma-70 family RNA polymerase sigma factor [Armatimonadota bacterium]
MIANFRPRSSYTLTSGGVVLSPAPFTPSQATAPMDDDRPEPTDEALMDRIAREDVSAFDLLVRRYQVPVYNYAFRMTGGVTSAEDLTQEAFLRVWRSRHRYESAHPFRTWLFTIARRLILDEWKKRPAPVPLTPAEEDALCGPRCEGPWERLMANELEAVMEAALAGLPEDLREALLLRDMEEMSYEQIARVVGCPVGTVKSRINAARNRLKERVKEWRKDG